MRVVRASRDAACCASRRKRPAGASFSFNFALFVLDAAAVCDLLCAVEKKRSEQRERVCVFGVCLCQYVQCLAVGF